MKLFSIYDIKSQTYSDLKQAPSTANAIRQFTSLCNNKDSEESQYPNDFKLFELGEFDKQIGQFTIYPEPQDLGPAANFKNDTH